jgi:excisionase family DNA binding protein
MTQPQCSVPLPDVLTVKEFATKFRLHPNTVRRLLRDGYLVGQRVGGQWRLIGEYIADETHQNASNCNTLQPTRLKHADA